jgi:hypothetical protein
VSFHSYLSHESFESFSACVRTPMEPCFERARLHSLLKNSFVRRFVTRARLQPCRKWLKRSDRALQAAEKLICTVLCNKGTASAGPQTPERNASGFSPCFASRAIQADSGPFSASCSVVPKKAKQNEEGFSHQGMFFARNVSSLAHSLPSRSIASIHGESCYRHLRPQNVIRLFWPSSGGQDAGS